MIEATKSLTRRDAVVSMIKAAEFTRQQIADKIGISVEAVNTQLTYIRLMGKYIKWNNQKILSFCSKEEFLKWEQGREQQRVVKSTTRSTKPVNEQIQALTKTVETQAQALMRWAEKLVKHHKRLEKTPKDAILLECKQEAAAQVMLHKIKIRRNQAKLDRLQNLNIT